MSARDMMTSFYSPFGPSFPGAYSPDAGDYVVQFRRGGGRAYGPGVPSLGPATPNFYNPPTYYQGWGAPPRRIEAPADPSLFALTSAWGGMSAGDFAGEVLQQPVTKWLLAGAAILALSKKPAAGLALAAAGAFLGWKACRDEAAVLTMTREAVLSIPGLPLKAKIAVSQSSVLNGWGAHGNSYGAWGSSYGTATGDEIAKSAESATEGAPGFANTITALAPTISIVADALTDPYRQVELLKVKVAHSSGKQREKYEAKLRAAQARLGIKEEGLSSTRDWRTLGKAGILTGIGLGAAVIFFILVKAMQPPRAARSAT